MATPSAVLLGALCLGLLLPWTATAGESPLPDALYPSDAGFIDIKRDCGAKGDGTADDTQAIRSAIRQAEKRSKTVYLPAGTYLVSEPISIRDFWIYVQGQHRDKTIIRLKDNCPGYTNAQSARWVFATIGDESKAWTNPDPNKKPNGLGGCNVGFFVYLQDLTIDTGAGNPGAIALHFISNNGGGLRNVTLRSGDGAGLMGLDLRRDWNGPCLFKNVTVRGFDYGVVTACWTYTSTFEDLTLENQRVTGFLNREHSVTIHRLRSRNKVPALLNTMDNDNSGPVVLLDAECLGGAPERNAVESRGPLYVRGLKSEGYRNAVVHRGKTLAGPSVDRCGTLDFTDVSGGASKPLVLPVQDPPALPWDAPADWVSVLSFGPPKAKFGNEEAWDATEALQKAIDSGKRTVYFPTGTYALNKTVIVRGAVRVFQGCGSKIFAPDSMKNGVLLRIEKLDGPGATVFLNRLNEARQTWGLPVRHVEHASGNLVIRDSVGLSYRSLPGCGDLFLDSVCVGHHGKEPFVSFEFNEPQKVWARDLNSESAHTKMVNKAAQLWILGLKTEGTGTTILQTGPQALTEVLGGLVYPVGGDWKVPAYVLEAGEMTLMHGFFGCNNTAVKDARNGAVKELLYAKIKQTSDRYLFFSSAASSRSNASAK